MTVVQNNLDTTKRSRCLQEQRLKGEGDETDRVWGLDGKRIEGDNEKLEGRQVKRNSGGEGKREVKRE